MPKVSYAVSPQGGGGNPLRFVTLSLNQATQGSPFAQTLTAIGGGGMYTFAITQGSLPAGVTFNNGVFGGTPTVSGAFTLTVSLTDQSGAATQANFTLSVASASQVLTQGKKFNPGIGMMTVTSGGVQPVEVSTIVSSGYKAAGTGAIGWYHVWYRWNNFEDLTLGGYNFKVFDDDMNTLQTAAPGCGIMVSINWYSNANVQQSDLATFHPVNGGIPRYIVDGSSSTYGAGPPGSPYSGWFADTWVNTTTPTLGPHTQFMHASLANANVLNRLQLMYQAFAKHAFTINSGPFKGNWTVDTCPLVEAVGTSTPSDTNMQSVPYVPSNYSVNAMNTAYQTLAQTVETYFPHTATFLMPGFGANNSAGGGVPSDQNTLIHAMLANPTAQSCTDVFSSRVVFNAPPAGIGGTLSGNFTKSTQNYPLLFSDGQIRLAKFTTNSSAVTWTGALTGSPSATATINRPTWAQYYAMGSNFDSTPGFQTSLLGNLPQYPTLQGFDLGTTPNGGFPVQTGQPNTGDSTVQTTLCLDNAFKVRRATHVSVCVESSSFTGIPTFWNAAVKPVINSYVIQASSQLLPVAYMFSPSTLVANIASTSITLNFTAIPSTLGAVGYQGSGLSMLIFDGAIQVGSVAASSGTFTHSGLTPGTQHTYTLKMSNANGTGPAGAATVVSTLGGTTQGFNFANFSGPPATIQTNWSAGFNGAAINLTNGPAVHQSGCAYYTTQQDIRTFTTDFTFQIPAGGFDTATNSRTGLTFVIQNTNATTTPNLAFGLKASSDANLCGYGAYTTQSTGILGNSIGIKFDLSNGDANYSMLPGVGCNSTALLINGGPQGNLTAACDLNPFGVNLFSGHVMSVKVVYDGALLTMTIRDTTTNAQGRYVWPVNIPAIVGQVAAPTPNVAWVGFTGGTVPIVANNILSWSFSTGFNTRLATPTMTPAAGQYAGTQSVTISGPLGASIYYTTNGLLPTSDLSKSTLYSGPITVSAGTVIQAVAIQAGFTDSLVAQSNYQIATANLINYPTGFVAGNLVLTGSAALVGSTIKLTDTSVGQETGCAWFPLPVSVTSFTSKFALQVTGGQPDGMTFCIQNQPPASDDTSGIVSVTGGPMAFGNSQSGMGYGFASGTAVGTQGGLQRSVAVKFKTSNNSTGVYVNGVQPGTPETTMTGINFANGHVFNVTVGYSGTTLTLTVQDATLGTSFSTSFTINIQSTVGGNTAYVGFTAGTGGAIGNQIVSNFTYALGTTVAPTVILQQPSNTSGLVRNTNWFIHGGTGLNNPPNGTFGLISIQSNPLLGSGEFQTNTWNASALTGFAPVNRSTAQLGYAATGTSPTTTAQWEGNQIGVYMQSSDRPGDPADSKMMICPEVFYAAQTLFTGPSSVLSASMDLQIPVATCTDNDVYLNVNHQLTHVSGLRITFNAKIFHLNVNGGGATTGFDVPTSTYIANIEVGGTGMSQYMTSTGAGVYSQSPWSGYRTYSWTITTAQFTAILGLLSAANPGVFSPAQLDPTQYTLTNLHINAEFHFNPAVATLGWSVRNWLVTTT